jgi:IS5 family transposase
LLFFADIFLSSLLAMQHRPPSFFDVETQLEKIYQLNDFLPKLKSLIDWEQFRGDLSKVREKERLSNAGRKPFDVVLMFKILILKKLHNLSDEDIERQIRDRLSFRDFLDLAFSDIVPDAKTIWLFAEQLKDHGLERVLFDRFDAYLVGQGFSAKSGTIVDGSFVEVPKQRNTKEENEQIKKGEIPESLSSNPHVLSQKDTDARWTEKNGVSYFGYKDHILGDDEYKFIRDYAVTDAAVHDSVPYLSVLPEKSAYPDQEAFGDSAYVGKETEEKLLERGFLPMICEKGYRNKPLTEEQKTMNKVKSSVRCRIEHIFGAMKVRCRDEILRTIGLERAAFWIGMRNLVYNLSRFVSLKCPKPVK